MRWLGRLLTAAVARVVRWWRTASAPAPAPQGPGLVRTAVAAAATLAGEAKLRHHARYGSDEQYRALLLAAVGALLSTVAPPHLAALATAAIGYSGLLDRFAGRTSAAPPPSSRYAPPRPASTLWDAGFGYDDD